MEFVTLNDGNKMPLEGFGVFQIPDAAQCEEVTYNAIKVGYRLIDTAAAYQNEVAVGKAIARAISEGLTPRNELFITTKVWVQDMTSEDSTYKAVQTSLKKLNLPYVDLILLHPPMKDFFATKSCIKLGIVYNLAKGVGNSRLKCVKTSNGVNKCAV